MFVLIICGSDKGLFGLVNSSSASRMALINTTNCIHEEETDAHIWGANLLVPFKPVRFLLRLIPAGTHKIFFSSSYQVVNADTKTHGARSSCRHQK